MVLDGYATLLAIADQLSTRRVHVDPETAVLLEEVEHGGTPPRCREVKLASVIDDRGGAQELLGQVVHEFLDKHHDVAVVGIRLVELEHRELGVVAGRQPLVAKHPGNLEHPLKATHGKPLEVQLRGDAQVQVNVEGVVVGGERACGGTTRNRVEHGGLDLDEVPILEPAAHQRHGPAAQREHPTGLVGHPQVHVALTKPCIGIRDAVPLVGEREAGLGQAHPRTDTDRELAPPCPDDLAGDPQPVADVEAGETVEVRCRGLGGKQLDAAGLVGEHAKCQLALVASQHQATGNGHLDTGLLAVLKMAVALEEVRHRGGGLEAVGRVVLGRGGHSDQPSRFRS